MKAFPALLLAAALLAPTVHAQETPAAPAPQEPAPAAASPATEAPAPAPATEAKPESKPAAAPIDLTPAQDVPTPKPESSLDLMPAQDSTPAPALEPALIPETPEATPKPEGQAIEEPAKEKKEKGKEQAKAKPNKTAAASDELAARIRFRQVKARVSQDPAIQAEWAKAETAPTDYEKREALKRYYDLLYTRMEKVDKSLKKEIESRRPATVRRLQQLRITPTEPPVRNVRTVRAKAE